MHHIKIKRHADFIGAVSTVLGFEPMDSFISLGVSRGGFVARVDHPHSNDALIAAATVLGGAYRRNPGGKVVLLSYTDNAEHALDTVTAVTAMADEVAEVVGAFRIDGDDVYDIPSGALVDHITPAMRQAHDAETIGEGRPAPLPSRQAREQALFAPKAQPAAENFEASGEALAAAVADEHVLQDEIRWVIETVRIHALTGLRIGDEDAARLIVAASNDTLMQAMIAQIDRRGSEGHAALWTDLVNRAPSGYATGPALAAAFAYWQVGDGAAAWMAYDRAAASANNPLACLIHTVLSEAINPGTWETSGSVTRLRAHVGPAA